MAALRSRWRPRPPAPRPGEDKGLLRRGVAVALDTGSGSLGFLIFPLTEEKRREGERPAPDPSPLQTPGLRVARAAACGRQRAPWSRAALSLQRSGGAAVPASASYARPWEPQLPGTGRASDTAVHLAVLWPRL